MKLERECRSSFTWKEFPVRHVDFTIRAPFYEEALFADRIEMFGPRCDHTSGWFLLFGLVNHVCTSSFKNAVQST